MLSMKRVIFGVSIMWFLFGLEMASAQNFTYHKTATIDKRIYQIIELSGSVNAALNYLDQTLMNFESEVRRSNKDIPEEVLNDMFTLYRESMMEMYRDEKGPININAVMYAKHLTENEIAIILNFYKGDLWSRYRIDNNSLDAEEKSRMFAESKRIFENESFAEKKKIMKREMGKELDSFMDTVIPGIEKKMERRLYKSGYTWAQDDENPYKIKKINTSN